ncbi:metal ABC transporter permease [Paenibacillus aestuarii]|uniref:Metal ABC transporter permease n=1 Tax=Paenibacillus aestuarii TaxID=516965 RepID=A0ABW0K867_9BACL|nr:metal ABC transporter permease [Paenibacillus aestuarii]
MLAIAVAEAVQIVGALLVFTLMTTPALAALLDTLRIQNASILIGHCCS